jgi:hypothetical protein
VGLTVYQPQQGDPVEKMLLRIIVALLTAIVIVFVLKPIMGLFAVMPSTGDAFADAWMFIIIPIAIVFIAVYRVFKVFL